MAGLSERRAMVRVGPPLSARDSRRGSVKLKEVPLLEFAEASELMLWPPSAVGAWTVLLVPFGWARMVLRSVKVPPSLAMLATGVSPGYARPSVSTEFEANVTLSAWTGLLVVL